MKKVYNLIRSFWFGVRAHKLLFPLRWILIIAVLGLMKDYLANDKALFAKVEGSWYFPVTEQWLAEKGLNKRYPKIQRIKWNKHEDFKIMPLVPYSARGLDMRNRNFVSPLDKQQISSFRYRHWLGTDNLGRDVFAGLLSGCRLVLYIIIIVGLLTAILGLVIGGFAGFLGDDTLVLRLDKLLYYGLMSIGLLYVFSAGINQYLNLSQDSEAWVLFVFLSILIFTIWVLHLLYKKMLSSFFGRFVKREFRLAVDSFYYFGSIVLSSLPVITILLAVLSNFKSPSFKITITLLSLFLWIGISRLIRGEVLRLREANFIQSARLMGLRTGQIFWRHIFPNIRQQLFINVSLVLSSAIILDASLSFLGIGMEVGEISWGILLHSSRSNLEAWWISLFPGLALVITVYSFNSIAERLKKES